MTTTTDEATEPDAAPPRRRAWRREGRAFLELFALCGIAFVQPTLDGLRRNSNDVFVASGASRLQIIGLVLIILVVPPAILYGIEVLIGLASTPARRIAHAVLGGVVAGVIVVQVLQQQTSLSRTLCVVGAVIGGAAATVLILRFDVARLFLRFLAVAPVAFALLFTLSEAVSPLVWAAPVAHGSDVTVARPRRVVMIVMDEFPLDSLMDGSGHIDAGLYPNFAKLAGGSTWYRNTTTVAPYTSAAVPALLSGNYPKDPRAVPTASEYPHNLFTLLGDRYELNTHETLEALNPAGDADGRPSMGWLLDKSYALWKYDAWPPETDLASLANQEISPDTVQDQLPAGEKFLDSLTRSDRPKLDYLHVLLPHVPWHLLPDGRSYTDLVSLPGLDEVWRDPALAELARQRYLLQLRAADHLLGQVIARLKQIGAYDRSLVVVTADHGEGFTTKNPARKATQANYHEVMWVPLFVKGPGQRTGRIDDRVARSIDVLPTIAGRLGTKLPWKVDGRSLDGPPRHETQLKLLEMPSSVLTQLPETATYQRWNGPAGFAKVLATVAAAPGGDEELRIYRGTSAFGDLVGRAAAPLVRSDAPATKGSFTDPGMFTDVDLHSPTAPWTYTQGSIDAPAGRQLAISVNGTIGSLATAIANPFTGGASFYALLPPTMFRDGPNDVDIYVVDGSPQAPRLTKVSATG